MVMCGSSSKTGRRRVSLLLNSGNQLTRVADTKEGRGMRGRRLWYDVQESNSPIDAKRLNHAIGKTSLLNVFTRGFFTQI
jgi:hypothetical protein